MGRKSNAQKAREAIARQAAAREAEARIGTPTPTRIDTNRFVLDGKLFDDDDPPSDDEAKTGELDAEFVRILRTAFQVKDDASHHEVFPALKSQGLYTWSLFIMIDTAIIRNLTKPTKRSTVPVLPQTKAILKSLLMLYLTATIHYEDAEITSTYTKEIILDYFKEERINRLQAIMDAPIPISSPTTSDNDSIIVPKQHYSKSKAEKQLDTWDKKGHDASTFPKLTKNEDYVTWKDDFGLLLKHERMLLFIDPDPQHDKGLIEDEHELELYDRKNTFFWLILKHTIQNPTARAVLNDYKTDDYEPDARAAFLAINLRMTTGLAQLYSATSVLTELDRLNIQSFNGTRTSFLATWFEKRREFNCICNKKDFMGFIISRGKLNDAIRSDTELLRIFDDIKGTGDDTQDFHLLSAALFDRALNKDKSDAISKQPTRVNQHDFEYQDEDMPSSDRAELEAYRAHFDTTLSIPGHIYSNITKEGRIAFRNLPKEDKRTIVSGMTANSTQSGSKQGAQRQVHTADQSDDIPSDEFEIIQENDDEFETLLEAFKTNFYKSNRSSKKKPDPAIRTSTYDRNKKPTKESLGSGHPAIIMSDNEKRQQQQARQAYKVEFEFPDDYQICEHHMCYTESESDLQIAPSDPVIYSVSKRNFTNEKALIDRGANGGIAGSDCVVIDAPMVPRTVNCTGIGNHQLVNIPIKTVGAYVDSQRGGVICIFHEMAYMGTNKTIISSIQLEDQGIKVDDKASHLLGNQMLTTSQGFCFPLAITNGLAYLKMRPYTHQEYQQCPHVIMTSDQIWDPRKYDSDIDMAKFKSSIPDDLHLLPNTDYNMIGQFIGVNQAEFKNPDEPIVRFWIPETDYQRAEIVARCSYGAKRTKAKRTKTVEIKDDSTLHRLSGPRVHTPSPVDYELLKPFFCWLPTNLIKKTFENSTQYGTLPQSDHGNLFQRFKSPHPAMNVNRLNDDLLMDKIQSNTPALNGGFSHAYIFICRKSHLIHPEHITPTRPFIQALQGFVTTWGAPNRVIGDSASSHYSHQVLDYLRMLWIQIWTSEPYYQHQNPFERRYQTFKRIVNRTMDRTGTPPHLWYLCICYVAHVLNRVSDPTLHYQQPYLVTTGQIADISSITAFQWMEPVYYKLNSSEFSFPKSAEGKGYFVGFSATIGHAMTFQLYIPNTNNILHRSVLRSAVTSENWNIRADDSLHKSDDLPSTDPTSDNGEISNSKFATPAQGFDLIKKGRDILQMGRKLFVNEDVTSGSNSNFIHRKGEKTNQASEPYPEAAYFQEDAIDIKTNDDHNNYG